MAREREIEEDREDLEEKPVKDKVQDAPLIDDEDDDNDDGPDNAEVRRQQKRREKDDEDAEDDSDARLAYDDDSDDGPEERGARSRRRRRNDSRRQAQAQSQAEIASLRQELAAHKAHLDGLSRGQLGLAAQDIDGQIRTTQSYLEQIDDAIEASFADEDRARGGATHRKALRLRDEALGRLNALGAEKQRVVQLADPRRQQQQDQPQTAKAIDPIAVKFSNKFMERHPWFDPADGTDEDSMIVKSIDDTLANEGFQANTKRYWIELERRIKARGIGVSGEGDDVEDDQDDEPVARKPRNTSGLPPRASRNGGGKRPPGTGFRLTADMKDTLDQLGLLDDKSITDDQRKYRKSLIGKWESGIKDARANGKL